MTQPPAPGGTTYQWFEKPDGDRVLLPHDQLEHFQREGYAVIGDPVTASVGINWVDNVPHRSAAG